MTTLCRQFLLGTLIVLTLLAATSAAAIITARNNTSTAFDNDEGATLTGFSLNNTVADTGSLLIVTYGGEVTSNPATVTFAGQPMLQGALAGTGTTRSSIWYLINPTATSGDIVVTRENLTTTENGYRIGVSSYGTDGMFLTPTSFASASDPGNGAVSLSVNLNDSANPGNPYLAIGSYGGNGTTADTPTFTGFESTLYNINTTTSGGYYVYAGYSVVPSGNTTLELTQNGARHTLAGLAVSVAAIPEPGSIMLSTFAVLGGIVCLLRNNAR